MKLMCIMTHIVNAIFILPYIFVTINVIHIIVDIILGVAERQLLEQSNNPDLILLNYLL